MKPYVCLLMLLLTLVSCNKSESPTTPSGSNDFIPLPLKVGNTWIYKHTVSGQTSYYTCSIVSSTTINSQLVYLLNEQWLFDKNAAYYTEGILHGMRVSSGPDQKIEVIYPKNPVVGQTWYVYDVSSGFKLEALNESVTVPAGTFSCSRLTGIPDSGDMYSVWYSNGKGIIKASYTSETYELSSLTIN
jgi:hypothetical protein